MLHIFFCTWLLKIILSCLPTCPGNQSLSAYGLPHPFLLLHSSLYARTIIQFNESLMCGRFSFSQYSVITNDPAVNNLVRVHFCIVGIVFSTKISTGGITGSEGKHTYTLDFAKFLFSQVVPSVSTAAVHQSTFSPQVCQNSLQ